MATADDLTARARIRDAALRQFGEQGFERTTIRGIAATAGVSPALVRHHFGSKDALRDAVDEHVLTEIRRINDECVKLPAFINASPENQPDCPPEEKKK